MYTYMENTYGIACFTKMEFYFKPFSASCFSHYSTPHGNPSKSGNLHWSRISKDTGLRGGMCTEKRLLYGTGSCRYGSRDIPSSAVIGLETQEGQCCHFSPREKAWESGAPKFQSRSQQAQDQAELLLQLESAGKQRSCAVQCSQAGGVSSYSQEPFLLLYFFNWLHKAHHIGESNLPYSIGFKCQSHPKTLSQTQNV